MTPHYADAHLEVWLGDVRAALEAMPAESVDCIITSPPYYSLRDYGLEPVVWGDPSDPLTHVHEWAPPVVVIVDNTDKRRWNHAVNGRGEEQPDEKRIERQAGTVEQGAFCACGAWRGQLGLEPDPHMFVDHLVEVFREARRVLKREGTLWLNLGDSYASKTRGSDLGWDKSRLTNPGYSQKAQSASLRSTGERHRGKAAGFKAKDRMGIPHRVVFALQDDGWWWRDEIVWHKNNPMPSSAGDRTTPSHEMVFTLTRSGAALFWTHRDGRRVDRHPPADYRWLDASTGDETELEPAEWRTERLDDGERRWRRLNLWEGHDYYYDAAATREGAVGANAHDLTGQGYAAPGQTRQRGNRVKVPGGWDVTKGDGGHGTVHRQGRTAATYRELALAGNVSDPTERQRTGINGRWEDSEANGTAPAGRNKRSVWTVATEPYPEAHFATFPTALIEPMILAGCPVGGVVLDPFGGSGTVSLVAEKLGRRSVFVDLSAEYVAQAIRRIASGRGAGDGPAVDMPVPFANDGLWAERG
jgi:DNA modification methylase